MTRLPLLALPVAVYGIVVLAGKVGARPSKTEDLGSDLPDGKVQGSTTD